MNTNTWLCSTLTSGQRSLCSAQASHVLCCSGSREKQSRQWNIYHVLTIQSMQAHNFWIRCVGEFSSRIFFLLFCCLGETLSYSRIKEACSNFQQLLYHLFLILVCVFSSRQIAHTLTTHERPRLHRLSCRLWICVCFHRGRIDQCVIVLACLHNALGSGWSECWCVWT